jgi:hypothetical protein
VWLQTHGAEVMRRIFGQGEGSGAVLMEEHVRGVGWRKPASAIAHKASAGAAMPERARSVANHRFLGLDETAARDAFKERSGRSRRDAEWLKLTRHPAMPLRFLPR